MGRVYKTANGKPIDIDNLRLVNEKTIAVGNMKVNARGDQLGPGGEIIQGRNQTMDQHYKIHTPIASENAVFEKQQQQKRAGARVAQGKVTITAPKEPELDPSGVPFDPPADTSQPALRGSLADSIAKQVTVEQELLTPPNKPSGPQRI